MTTSVTRIGLTPVKGMRHTGRDQIELQATGPRGDRLFAFVAGDRVLRTASNPALIAVQASFDEQLTLRLPDGTVVSGPVGDVSLREVEYWGRPVASRVQQGPHADAMSSHLNQRVDLVRAEPGEFVYGECVSLISSKALAEIGGDTDPARFRATFVVDADPRPGEQWRLGEALIEIVAPIIRCAVIDADPTTGTGGDGVLKKVADRDPSLAFGVDARVLRPGLVRLGDRVARQ